MGLFTVLFADGSRARVNARNVEHAVLVAHQESGKVVVSVSLGKPVMIAPVGSFESMKRGGPNC